MGFLLDQSECSSTMSEWSKLGLMLALRWCREDELHCLDNDAAAGMS